MERQQMTCGQGRANSKNGIETQNSKLPSLGCRPHVGPKPGEGGSPLIEVAVRQNFYAFLRIFAEIHPKKRPKTDSQTAQFLNS